MRKVNVSCVQMKPILADYDGNIDRMVEFFNQIMDQRPETDLIVYLISK